MKKYKNKLPGTCKNSISSFSSWENAGDEVVKKTIFRGGLLFVLSTIMVFFWGCSKDTWNKHYEQTSDSSNIKSVIEGLRQKGYNEFASALEKVNLGTALNSGMQFTVFAVPDQAFREAAANLSDDELKHLLLNHMFGGKHHASSFKDTLYQALGGNILYIWMNRDSLSNFYRESSQIVTKDIDVSDAVIFELSKCIKIYPNINSYFPANYSFFYELYKNYFIPDVVQYPLILGLSSNGLQIDTIYKYRTKFTLTNSSSNLTFVVNKNDFAGPAYNYLLSKYLPYFAGAEDTIKNDFTTNTRLKHVILSSSYNTSKDSVIMNNLKGDKLKFPASVVKEQVILDNGNKLFVIDTMLYDYPIKKTKYLPLSTYLSNSNTRKTNGNFNNVTVSAPFSVVNWKTPPQPGDYIECTIPRDSIYSKPYDVYLQYVYKNTYVKIKVYFDGDSLNNRVDLGSTVGAIRIGTTGNNYQYNIGSGFNIRQYSTHTIRFEVTDAKGNATEIMRLWQIVLKLQD